jgi:hypothetical protein
MYSTVIDLYKWHRAMKEGKVIDKKILQEAYLSYTAEQVSAVNPKE